MSKLICVIFTILCFGLLPAQNSFEGVFTVEFKNEKKELSKLEVKVKDKLVHLKSIQGGISKYAYYLLNLETREFYTVSDVDKKIIIKYDIDKLMGLYESKELKVGFKINSPLTFKSTDKKKEENMHKLTKYVGENDIYKSSFWYTNADFNFNQLIPVLRLLNCWNEAQLKEGFIVSAEVTNKVSKRESSLHVIMKKQTVSKEIFELPQNYTQKNFAKLMEDEKDNENLKTIIQTFAEF